MEKQRERQAVEREWAEGRGCIVEKQGNYLL